MCKLSYVAYLTTTPHPKINVFLEYVGASESLRFSHSNRLPSVSGFQLFFFYPWSENPCPQSPIITKHMHASPAASTPLLTPMNPNRFGTVFAPLTWRLESKQLVNCWYALLALNMMGMKCSSLSGMGTKHGVGFWLVGEQTYNGGAELFC